MRIERALKLTIIMEVAEADGDDFAEARVHEVGSTEFLACERIIDHRTVGPPVRRQVTWVVEEVLHAYVERLLDEARIK